MQDVTGQYMRMEVTVQRRTSFSPNENTGTRSALEAVSMTITVAAAGSGLPMLNGNLDETEPAYRVIQHHTPHELRCERTFSST